MQGWENQMKKMAEADKQASKILTSVGVKFDQDKPRTDLLDPLALEGLSKVLAFGAKKYAANNWRGGISYTRLLGAALRHTFAILRGEDLDPESGLPHVDHLGCCWMFASNMMKTRPDMDDRWQQPKREGPSPGEWVDVKKGMF
jgi:hypothetical protein